MNATVTGLTANTLYTCGVQSRGQSSASASAQSNVVTGTSSTLMLRDLAGVHAWITCLALLHRNKKRLLSPGSPTASQSLAAGSPAITGSVVRADSVTLSFAAPTNANAGPVAHYKAACVPSSSVLAYSGDSNSDANGKGSGKGVGLLAGPCGARVPFH